MAIHSIALIFIFQFLQIPGIDAKVSSIIVFGDSTVDSGNNNFIPTILRSDFRPYGRDFDGGRSTGRFSNGRIPTDFISEAFGLKPTVPAYLDPAFGIKDFASGVCFASAETGYDNATSRVLIIRVFSQGLPEVFSRDSTILHYRDLPPWSAKSILNRAPSNGLLATGENSTWGNLY
ncbi:GDSL esterase/lipase [Abeliophyllum distichum]|uniref:GDSL esterase/lipase n=1 Tax=Abeliophyllum distichum TaxID=126358 RepID=A0ABD1PSQ4_9LAMI